jgi:hypothetical protein
VAAERSNLVVLQAKGESGTRAETAEARTNPSISSTRRFQPLEDLPFLKPEESVSDRVLSLGRQGARFLFAKRPKLQLACGFLLGENRGPNELKEEQEDDSEDRSHEMRLDPSRRSAASRNPTESTERMKKSR